MSEQKAVILKMDSEFLAEIDKAFPVLGYGDRATFIRDAVLNHLAQSGINLPATYKAAPSRAGKGGRPKFSSSRNIVTFPEAPLFHAAAGFPIDSHEDTYTPDRELGPGRFAVQLHGDSMAPRFPDRSIVIMRERGSLKRQTLKKGEIYLFIVDGEKTVKAYGTRPATPQEIEAGISYTSKTDGTQKVALLKSLNTAFPDIIAKEPIDWIGWLDKADN